MTCFGQHDYGPPNRKGRQVCRRCGVQYPPEWAWWAREPADTQPSLFGDAA